MPINLNNLNISLDQFNAVSNGKYNIGQLKLSDDGASVYRTNNHKTLTFLNTTKISPDEALAVKLAFCKALQKGGLDADKIAGIKIRLGIPKAGVATFRALNVGSVKPLTAEDVRSIIDENVSAGAFKPKTMESLGATKGSNGGVSEETMKSRAATREKINNRTFENNRTSMANNTVNYLLNIMEYSEKNKTIPSNFEKSFAQVFKNAIENKGFDNKNAILTLHKWSVGLSYGTDGKIIAKIAFDDGKEMSLNTDMTREQLREKLAAFIAAGTGNAETQVKEKKGVAADGASSNAEGQVKEKKDAAVGGAGGNVDTRSEEYKLNVLKEKLAGSKGGQEFYNELTTALQKTENADDRSNLIWMATQYADLKGDADAQVRMNILKTVAESLPKIKDGICKERLVKIAANYVDFKNAPVVEKSNAVKGRASKTEVVDKRAVILEGNSKYVLESLKIARGLDFRNTDLAHEVTKAFETSGTDPKNPDTLSPVIQDLANVFSNAQIGRSEMADKITKAPTSDSAIDNYSKKYSNAIQEAKKNNQDKLDEAVKKELNELDNEIETLNINEWLSGT